MKRKITEHVFELLKSYLHFGEHGFVDDLLLGLDVVPGLHGVNVGCHPAWANNKSSLATNSYMVYLIHKVTISSADCSFLILSCCILDAKCFPHFFLEFIFF